MGAKRRIKGNEWRRIDDDTIAVKFSNYNAEFLIDAEDLPIVMKHTWTRGSGGATTTVIRVDGKPKTLRLHSLLTGLQDCLAIHGRVNGDILDMRKKNITYKIRAENNVYRDAGDGTIYVKFSNCDAEFRIDKEDEKLVKQYIWRCSTRDRPGGYACCNGGDGKAIFLHRLLMGLTDEDTEIKGDHINRDKLDNRRCNLRTATDLENSRNKSIGAHNTSGFRGVWMVKSTGKWLATITTNGKLIHLESFDDVYDAAKVRIEAEKILFKEYAPTHDYPWDKINASTAKLSIEKIVRLQSMSVKGKEGDIAIREKLNNNTSGYTGVSLGRDGRWKSRIEVNGVGVTLCTVKGDKKRAIKLRLEAELYAYGHYINHHSEEDLAEIYKSDAVLSDKHKGELDRAMNRLTAEGVNVRYAVR